MVSNIASLATAMKHDQAQQEAGTRVARMAMDTAKETGDALVKMMEMQKEISQHLGGSVNTWS